MIPFLDLKAQYDTIKDEIQAAMGKVLDSTQYSLGEEVDKFEQEFANYCNVNYGVGVNSGASALHLALLALGIKPGDEVITVSATFVATVAAIGYVGAKAVLIDIDPTTLNMDVNQLESAITNKTRAILPVHLHGQPADINAIMEIARKHDIPVIEDAAQAHGAEYHGKRTGSLGDLACFSFYPGKNLGAYGEAGMVVTNNPRYAETIRMLRDWGQAAKYEHRLKGYNYRMDGLQAAVLRIKLGYLDDWTDKRRKNAGLYTDSLDNLDVTTPVETIHVRHVYHVYTIRHETRNNLRAYLSHNSIQTGIHYPIPVHLQTAYSDLGYRLGDLPVTEKVADEILSLPMYPELTASQIDTVTSAIRDYLAQ